jgi:hypothetical protein
MQTAKTDPNEIYADIHRLLLTTIRGDPNGGRDKVFYLLGQLDADDKQQFWVWLDQCDRNLKQWLMTQGNQRRAE